MGIFRGDVLAGRAIRRADAAKEPRVHRGRRSYARSRDRRKYGHFQFAERGYAAVHSCAQSSGTSGPQLVGAPQSTIHWSE